MTKQETIQIITLLAGNYDSIAQKTIEQKQLMIATWLECLGDLEYNIVLQSVKKAIMDSPYPPTIHDIRKNAIEFINPTQEDPLDDWNEAYRMIQNGSYMTQEQFEQCSPICKKFFGSVDQLRAYSRNPEFNMDVTRANFFKQHENLVKREKENKLLPDRMKELVTKLAQGFEIKQIEEGKNGTE